MTKNKYKFKTGSFILMDMHIMQDPNTTEPDDFLDDLLLVLEQTEEYNTTIGKYEPAYRVFDFEWFDERKYSTDFVERRFKLYVK